MMTKAMYALVLFVTLAFISPGLLSTQALADTQFYIIGTGDITGVYYPTGGSIAQIVNKKRKEYGMRLIVEPTSGSVFNVNAVMAGDIEFGIVQSDRQYQATKGLAEWKDKGSQKKLKAIFSIHPESITLVAAVDSGINSMNDLKGKRVNIGNLGSGQRQNSIDALEAVGIDWKDDIKAMGLKASEAPRMLQDGLIDAFFYTVGHPSGAIKEATSCARKVKFVSIKLPDSFYKKFPYYTPSFVPVSHYPGSESKSDIATFGVKATFVTSSDVPDSTVYAVAKEIFENFELFKTLHPAYSTLTKKSMLEGLSAPIHKGAMKYYKEAGLK
jgi:hypothetical protein